MNFQDNYVQSAIFEFKRFKKLGDRTFEQIAERDIHWTLIPNENSIAIIVKHLVGNMLSRWTNFLSEDGEKPWRNRDSEFEDAYASKKEMVAAWEKSWNYFFNVLETINSDNIETSVKIRNEKHSVTEAINRQLSHYAYHIGQIVMLGKMTCGEGWESLSIPKGESVIFNKEKFSK